MNPLLEQFVIESRDFLERIADRLLALERDPGDSEAIGELFRGVHTLKGNSGLFPEYAAFTRLVHAGEDLLESVRGGRTAFNGEIADRLLECMDVVSGMLDNIEAGEDLATELCQRAEDLAVALRALLAAPPVATKNDAAKAADTPPAARDNGPADGLLHFRYDAAQDCFFKGEDPLFLALGSPGLRDLRVSAVEPWPALKALDPFVCNLRFDGWCAADRATLEDHFRYVAEQVCVDDAPVPAAGAPVPIPAAEPARQRPGPKSVATPAAEPERTPARPPAVEPDPSAVARILRGQYEALARLRPEICSGVLQGVAAVLRSLAANRGFALGEVDAALAAAQAAGNGDPLAILLDRMAAGTAPPREAPEAPATEAADPASAGGGKDLSEEEAGMVERLLESQRRLLAAKPDASALQSVGNVLVALRRYQGVDSRAIEQAAGEAVATANGAPLTRIIDSWHQGSTPTLPVAANEPADLATAEPPPAVAAAEPVLRQASPGETTQAALNDGTHREDHPSHRVLKVAQEKIDRLMDLIGEMVVAKNSLPYLASRAETSSNPREIAREIKNQYGVINRIAGEMQDAIMQVRMMPVGSVLQRFPRLVRDISRKLGKQVELYMEGEDTEADKNIVESLADPLIHIVRNSLDHGLETPDERRAAGKPATGMIRVTAFQEADRVIIEIGDDGRGIDPQRIRAKALERGLIDAARAAQMSDAEALQLVFAAGLSTAEQVSDLSGRGVGMDVVRTAIEKAHGQVQLSSEVGRGTSIRIVLPLSMAVTNIMIIRSAGQMFGVQMDLVVETVRVPQAAMHQIKHQRTTVLRGRIVPLYGLNDLLGIDEPPVLNEEGEAAVLVIRVGGQDVGVVVDDFDATLDLILKPLDGPLGELGGYAGTALLGDGSVLMVLNLKELL